MGSPVDLTLGHHHHHNNHYAAAAAAAAKNVDRKAEEYLRALEDERRKIEGFKRELPLCIQLLEDAIESSIEQLASESNKGMPTQPLQLRSLSGEETESNVSIPPPSERPVLEEFMPLKKRWERQEQEEEEEQEQEQEKSGRVTEVQEKCIERPRSSSNGLPAWMAEAQLWTHYQQNPNSQEPSSQARSLRPEDPKVSFGFEEHRSKTHSQLLFSSKKRPAGAFVPFIPERPVATPLSSRSSARTRSAGPDLSLSSGEHPVSSPNGHHFGGAESEVRSIDVSRSTNNLQDNPFSNKGMGMESPTPAEATPTLSAGVVGQSQRKARRCWSTELHRRFVSVLHQLGGSQVATPKQIRELMKVDGLTNDEVKSHLQKYRLHTRRPSPCPQPGSSQPPQLVVLGWVPPEYVSGCQPSSVVYNPTSGQPSENAQYRQPPMSPDYINCMKNSPMGTPVQIQQQPLPEAQQAASQTQSSQQAPVQVASQLSSVTQATSSKADQEESGGEGKSDSASWKGRPSSGDEAMHGDESTEDFKSFSKQKRTVSRIHMPCGTRTQVSSLEVAQKVL